MFTIDLVGQEKVIARFGAMPDKVRAALRRKIYALAIELANRVRQKLSGQVLQVRSGDLRASIFENVDETETSIIGRVGSSGDVKYAAIHEYGGTIPAHEVVPSKAQALAFVWQGKQVFFKHVHIPDVHMPERSYLRSSLAEMKQEIISEIQSAAHEGMS